MIALAAVSVLPKPTGRLRRAGTRQPKTVLQDLSVERRARDTENSTAAGLVTAGVVQYALDMFRLHLVERAQPIVSGRVWASRVVRDATVGRAELDKIRGDNSVAGLH